MPKSPKILKRHPGIIVMGVCGTGKSLIAKSLVARINNAIFLEGDNFHPIENINLMTAGIPLSDQNRKTWLDLVGHAMESARLSHFTLCSCSALKKIYRDQLRALSPDLIFIYLAGDKALIEQRMTAREHFMPTVLLDSQLKTLEPPLADEEKNIITCDIRRRPKMIIDELIANDLSALITPTQYIEAEYD